jgi:hypothetical protein
MATGEGWVKVQFEWGTASSAVSVTEVAGKQSCKV